jgi:hypothetical protein
MVEEAQGMERSLLYGVTALGEMDQRRGVTPVLSWDYANESYPATLN